MQFREIQQSCDIDNPGMTSYSLFRHVLNRLKSVINPSLSTDLYSPMHKILDVRHKSISMKYISPNRLCRYRIKTFSTKEPDTLNWIDAIPEGKTLWDVGANIGLYSIYAARSKNCSVYAFEPSVFNMEVIARNIFVNNLQDKITLVPLALSDRSGSNVFKMSTTVWGGALSGFGVDFDQNGKRLLSKFEYTTLGVSMDEMLAIFNLPPPDYVKIDVDGIEHYIVRGATQLLRNATSVLVEINDAFIEQAEETQKCLTAAGLVLYKKCDLGVPNQYNQWWIRNDSPSIHVE